MTSIPNTHISSLMVNSFSTRWLDLLCQSCCYARPHQRRRRQRHIHLVNAVNDLFVQFRNSFSHEYATLAKALPSHRAYRSDSTHLFYFTWTWNVLLPCPSLPHASNLCHITSIYSVWSAGVSLPFMYLCFFLCRFVINNDPKKKNYTQNDKRVSIGNCDASKQFSVILSITSILRRSDRNETKIENVK